MYNIDEWINDNCNVGDIYLQSRKELYENYITWLKEKYDGHISNRTFYDYMNEKFKQKNITGVFHYKGIKVKKHD